MPGLALLLLSPPACRVPRTLRAAVAGRTVLITGASRGIGEAAARLFAQAGAEVLLLARSAGELERVAGEIRRAGGLAWVYPLDLAQPEAVARVAQVVLDTHPRIDVIVSNAGKSICRSALHASERNDLGRSLAVNFSGPAALLLALLPRLVSQGGAQVVNVSTVSARPPAAPRWGAYQGSKAGFDVWLRAMGTELRAQGLTVSSVYMPLVLTRMSAGPRYRHHPALTPLEAAQVIAGAVVRPAPRLAPWWLGAQELAALLFPGVVETFLIRLEAAEQRRTNRGDG